VRVRASQAHQALTAKDKSGTMLPGHVILKSAGDGRVDVAANGQRTATASVGKPALAAIASPVATELGAVIAAP
jgi:hypothetical protein